MEIENLDMKKVFIKSLNERQKRQFLAVEANRSRQVFSKCEQVRATVSVANALVRQT